MSDLKGIREEEPREISCVCVECGYLLTRKWHIKTSVHARFQIEYPGVR